MSSSREAIVVFRDGRNPMRKMLKSGFSHVEIYLKSKDIWVGCIPMPSELDIHITGHSDESLMAAWQYYKATKPLKILYVRFNPAKRAFASWWPINMVTCTLVVKYYLGIRLMQSTPYGLYHWLKRLESTGIVKQGILEVRALLEG